MAAESMRCMQTKKQKVIIAVHDFLDVNRVKTYSKFPEKDPRCAKQKLSHFIPESKSEKGFLFLRIHTHASKKI